MEIIPIQTPSEGNPYYPLPLDYPTLSLEGKREARINAIRQWLLPGDAQSRVQTLIASYRFLDLYYLTPDPDQNFDPMFYDAPPLPTPPFHYEILSQWATNRMNIAVCPRGSAKTTVNRKDILLRLLSRPGYSIVYSTSTHENARQTGQVVRDQCFENPRIFNDLSGDPSFEGKIKPSRGENPVGVEMFYLNNGSWLRCISAESRQRGIRPRRYRLDDPEYDAKASTSMPLLREYMEELLFKVIMPMVMRADCGVDWLATFVSKRHYAWKAMEMKDSGDGLKISVDPRFNFWDRLLVKAAYEGPDGSLISCWPEMWPATTTDRLKLAETQPRYKELFSLEEIRASIGTHNFNSEYMGKPGDGEQAFFPNLVEEKHGYSFSSIDENFADAPTASSALIHWTRNGTPHSLPLHEFCKRARLFITVDTSFTNTTTSDYKVCCLMGYLPEGNELFVLDLWCKQASEQALIRAIFALADRWKVPSIHPEVIKQSVSLYNNLESICRTRAIDVLGCNHIPRIVAIRPGQEEKTQKILSLAIRFEHGLIKLPLYNRNTSPWYHLFEQIEGFNPEVADGGLQHDDALDAVSMSRFVIRGRTIPLPDTSLPDTNDVVELLKRGHKNHPVTGLPLGLGVDWSRIDPEAITTVFNNQTPSTPKEGTLA